MINICRKSFFYEQLKLGKGSFRGALKKNWVDQINTTEYMQRDSESFKQKGILSPNCDRHGCYNYGPKAHPQNW